MKNTILSNKKIHQATVLAYRGEQKVAELSKGGMSCDSPFFIASISKLYTHAMAFVLIDKQLLAYTSRLVDLLPADKVGCLPNAQEINVRHLIDQTSGFANHELDKLPDGTVLFEEVLRHDRAVDVAESLRLVAALPPKGKPGSRAYYADINALLLGEICQTLTGKTLPALLAEIICQPLALKNTHYCTADKNNIVPIYNGSHAAFWLKYLSAQMAQGGIVATNYELMQFLQAFMRGQLFSENHLTHPDFRRIQFIPLKYGSGMMQLKIPRILSPFVPAPEIIGHSGSSGSFAFYCPSKDVFITGTINQLQHRPFAVIYRTIDKV